MLEVWSGPAYQKVVKTIPTNLNQTPVIFTEPSKKVGASDPPPQCYHMAK